MSARVRVLQHRTSQPAQPLASVRVAEPNLPRFLTNTPLCRCVGLGTFVCRSEQYVVLWFVNR